MTEVRYVSGGNPSVSEGLFVRSEGQRRGKRIAWWPAGYEPTQVNMGLILREYERTGQTVSRQRCREILDEDPGISAAAEKRIADRIDGYDRDDLGESPDY